MPLLPPESSFIVSIGADAGACVVGAGVGADVGADVGACVVGAGVGTFIRWLASGKLKAPQEKKTLAKFAEYS